MSWAAGVAFWCGLSAVIAAFLAWLAVMVCLRLAHRVDQGLAALGRCGQADPDFSLPCIRVDGHKTDHETESGWKWPR